MYVQSFPSNHFPTPLKKKIRKSKISNPSLILKEVAKVQPLKFLQPIDTYNLFGMFFLHGNQKKCGIFHAFNVFRKISRVDHTKNYSRIITSDLGTFSGPSNLLIDRLKTLADKDALDLADAISRFGSYQKKIFECSEPEENMTLNFESAINIQDNREYMNFADEMGLIRDRAAFVENQELEDYLKFANRIDIYLKELKNKMVFISRAGGNRKSTNFSIHNFLISNEIIKLMSPDEIFVASSLCTDGCDVVKCGNFSYFKSIYEFLNRMSFELEKSLNGSSLEEIEPMDCAVSTLNDITVPAKMSISLKTFRSKNIIEIIRITEIKISEKDNQILLRRENGLEKEMNEKHKEFISQFYPNFIPKNSVPKNKGRICGIKNLINL